MKKLPKLFSSKIENVNNNRKVFDSLKDYNIDIKDNNNLSLKDKLKELTSSNTYIFNKEVILVFKDKEVSCHIAGIVNNHIITMDNEIIKIKDLIDIKY